MSRAQVSASSKHDNLHKYDGKVGIVDGEKIWSSDKEENHASNS